MVSRLIFNARRMLLGLSGLIMSMSVGAYIDVNPKFVEIETSSLSLTVTNQGEAPEFVDVVLSRIENPGVTPDKEQLVPISLIANPDVYASPFKLTLGPRQEKKITIQVLHQPLTEQVYRLSVMPKREVTLKNTQSPVMSVGLGYLVLIRQQPEKRTNVGHTSVLIMAS